MNKLQATAQINTTEKIILG